MNDFFQQAISKCVKHKKIQKDIKSKLVSAAQPVSVLTQATPCFLGWEVGSMGLGQSVKPYWIPMASQSILLHLWHSLRISSKENSVALWNTESLLLQPPSLLSSSPWTSLCMGKCEASGDTYVHKQQEKKSHWLLNCSPTWSGMYHGANPFCHGSLSHFLTEKWSDGVLLAGKR